METVGAVAFWKSLVAYIKIQHVCALQHHDYHASFLTIYKLYKFGQVCYWDLFRHVKVWALATPATMVGKYYGYSNEKKVVEHDPFDWGNYIILCL